MEVDVNSVLILISASFSKRLLATDSCRKLIGNHVLEVLINISNYQLVNFILSTYNLNLDLLFLLYEIMFALKILYSENKAVVEETNSV